MTLEEIRKDTEFWQRLLRLAGYYKGKVDGIRGKLTEAAEQAWDAAQQELWEKYGRLDVRSESNLRTLLPEAQELARKWLAEAVPYAARQRGLVLKVICGTRSYAEQSALYAQGRTKPGAVVTNARAGSSNHNFGVAFDVGLFDGRGNYLTADTEYDRLAKACPPPAGLEWGGSWKSLHDAPHYQYARWGSTAKELRKVF